MNLELVSLFRHIVAIPPTPILFNFGEVLSLAVEDNLESKGYDIASGSTGLLLGIPF